MNAIIHQQIGQQISVSVPHTKRTPHDLVGADVSFCLSKQIDTISEVLQQRCGSFCRADDVILFKAMEGMRRANETRDPAERRECLQESLRYVHVPASLHISGFQADLAPLSSSLFAKGTSNLSLEKLKQTCSEYLSLHFPMGQSHPALPSKPSPSRLTLHLPTGAIELPLKCAHDWDPEESAFGFWRDGEHEHDPRRTAFERRKECYAIVFSTLLAFDEMLDDEAAGRSRANGKSAFLDC